MGRAKLFRQKLVSHVDSVAVKTVSSWLLQQTREHFGVAFGEAEQVAQKGYLPLTRTLVKRSEEQILFVAIAGREIHRKRPTQELPRQEVVLTPWSHDDLELQREFGLKVLQNARLARLIEEAYWQDASLCTSMLCFLTNITAKSIRERLAPLWEAGIRLPVAAMAKKYRQGRGFRAAAALEEFLGECCGIELWERPTRRTLSFPMQRAWRIPCRTSSAILRSAMGRRALRSCSAARKVCTSAVSFE